MINALPACLLRHRALASCRVACLCMLELYAGLAESCCNHSRGSGLSGLLSLLTEGRSLTTLLGMEVARAPV